MDPVKDEAVEEDGNSERYKVLVVEDNASLLAWLKEILSSRYDVYTASDGADALDIVNDVLPDMVLTDIIMPKVDGYELCRRIKEDKLLSHIPVVILTSRTVLDVLSEAIDEGTVLRADDVRLIPLPAIILNLLLRSESLTQFLPCGKNVPYQGHDHLRAERLGHIKVGPVLIPRRDVHEPGQLLQEDEVSDGHDTE